MRNTLLDPYEDVPRDVVVTMNDYPSGSTFPLHAHRRGQFAFASRGAISLATSVGSWVVPPRRACWLPAGVEHEMTMRGTVTMLNAFVSDDAARAVGLPAHCGVYRVSTLLRQLLDDAVDLPALYDDEGRAGKLMALLVAEMATMQQLSLSAPLPTDPRLVRVCQRLFSEPSITFELDAAAFDAGMSRRTFTRLFQAQCGLSFGTWRRQVCLLTAIERLSAGHPVTQVALDLGYASPSAFAAAFRHVLGETPSQYVQANL